MPKESEMFEFLEGRVLMARTPGIDVSHWQGAINWTSVAAAGKQFVFQKATEGTSYVDPTVATNTSGARSAGLLVGVYHFAHPDTNSAAAEAAHFLSGAANYIRTGFLRPVLDLEDGASLGKAALSTWVAEWCATVKAAVGADPIIYCNTNYATNYLNTSAVNSPLWIANWSSSYGDPNGTGSPPAGVWGAGGWDFWQYSATGSVSGIAGDVDLDVFDGTRSTLEQQFVIQPHASISGKLFNDFDGDGVKDAGEAGIAGRTVWIDADNDGVLDVGERSAVTGTTGSYAFTGLAEGSHTLRQVVPTGWTATKPVAKRVIALADGQAVTGANFGSWQNVTISGGVFNDANKDGLWGSGEPGLTRWQVFADLDNDGVLDASETSVRTNDKGRYTFTTLTAGTYTIRVVQQDGWRRTTQSSFLLTLAPGGISTNKLFGEKRIA